MDVISVLAPLLAMAAWILAFLLGRELGSAWREGRFGRLPGALPRTAQRIARYAEVSWREVRHE